MVSDDEDFAKNVVDEAVLAANCARSTKKKRDQAETEALALAHKEIKRKANIIDFGKAKAAKKTMPSYFQLSCGVGGATVGDGLRWFTP